MQEEHDQVERTLGEVAVELEARHQDIRSLQDALGHAERRAQEAESMRDELAAAQGAREAVQARELATMQTARDAARTDHERTRERLEALRRSIEEALGDEGAAPEEPEEPEARAQG